MIAWLHALACTAEPSPSQHGPVATPTLVPSTSLPSSPLPEPAEPVGVLVACGGGSEGDIGDADAWSNAYADLLEGGDISGDGQVHVAVLSVWEETDWLPSYLESLGADDAFNLRVDTLTVANDPSIEATFAAVDAVFIKGGDQGAYYDRWNDSLLEAQILDVHNRGGGVGGTSAGAASLSEYALTGSADFYTAQVLVDSHTAAMDDVGDGDSGIHTDFLNLAPNTLIDSHFSTRARLGRLAGMMAKAIDDGGETTLVGIGVDEATCATLRGDEVTVSGVGSVVFLRGGAEPALRIPGEPLVWAGLSLDRLTDGWRYDLAAHTPIPPPDAEAVAWDGLEDPPSAGTWRVDGDTFADEEGFEHVVSRWPNTYAVRTGTADLVMYETVGLTDAFDDYMGGVYDEVLFRTLYDHLGATGFLVGGPGALERPVGAGGVVRLTRGGSLDIATIVLDASGVTWRSLSPWASIEDNGDGSLHAAGLVGMKMHVLYTDGADGRAYDVVSRAPVAP